jgi:glucose-6-phosphate 1-dehydrogenase
MAADRVDALVIFGATGDLAKLETFPVHPYPQGSWGPKESDRLLTGRAAWHDPAS